MLDPRAQLIKKIEYLLRNLDDIIPLLQALLEQDQPDFEEDTDEDNIDHVIKKFKKN